MLEEEHPEKVISLLIKQQEEALSDEISEKQEKLGKLRELKNGLKIQETFSLESIGDIAVIMQGKKKLKKLRWTSILTGIPVTALQWFLIILWIIKGYGSLVIWVIVAAVWGTIISRCYFKNVKYICPECHEVFKPTLKEAFWANHTPTTRKLTCTKCAHKGFCVEIWGGDEKSRNSKQKSAISLPVLSGLLYPPVCWSLGFTWFVLLLIILFPIHQRKHRRLCHFTESSWQAFFEECGRHIVLKGHHENEPYPENAVMYGIGHGGIEILSVLLPSMILYLVIAVLFSAGNIENALSTLNIAEDTAAAALPSVQAAAAFDYAMMAMNVIDRLLAMLLHIGLTVIIYYGVLNAKKNCLPSAIILHMLMDTFPALYQRSVVPLWAVEIWVALWAAVIVFVAVKLYRKMKVSSSTETNG